MKGLQETSTAVAAYLERNEPRILSELMELVRIPSVESEPLPEQPFGVGPAEALEAAAQLYESYGFCVERSRKSGYAVATEGVGPRSIGVFCHCDVVSGSGNWEYTKPFEPVIRDDVLIGRGVKDNKAGVIAALHALAALKETGVTLNHQIRVVLGSNEETGMADMENFVKEQPMPDLSLVPDCEFPICRGEKSYCHFETQSLSRFHDIIDFSGGDAINTVCGAVTVTLRHSNVLEEQLYRAVSGRDDAEMEIDQNGNILLKAKGISFHAASPFGSVNAGSTAAEILLACPSISEKDRKVLEELRQLLGDYLGAFFEISYEDDDFQQLTDICGVIRTENQQPKLIFAMNYNTVLNVDDLLTRVKNKLTSIGWTYTFLDDSAGFLKAKDHPFVKFMNEVYLAQMGMQERDIYTTRAGTYARMLKNAFAVGADVPKTVPPADFPQGHGLVHQPDECISIKGLMDGIRLLAMMLLMADRHLDEFV